MRNRVIEFRARLLSQAAVAAVLAGTAAGCSADATRFHDPLFTGSTENQHEIISSGQPMPPAIARGDGAVAKADLPPPAGAAASSGAIAGPGAAPPAQPVLPKSGPSAWPPTRAHGISLRAARPPPRTGPARPRAGPPGAGGGRARPAGPSGEGDPGGAPPSGPGPQGQRLCPPPARPTRPPTLFSPPPVRLPCRRHHCP